MKKFIYSLLALLITSGLVWAASTYTTNYNLTKPGVGDVGWGAAVNTNFDTIDTQMKTTADAVTTHVADTSTHGVSGDVVGTTDTQTLTNKTITGTFTGNLTGNASTSTALASNPTDCSASNFATTIDANGNLTCAQPAFTDISGSVTDAQVPDTITASNYQLTDSDLTALAGTSTTGLYVINSAGSSTTRTLVAGSNKVSVQHGAGTSGNPSIDVNESNLTLSNLGGAVTDSQVPNNITIDLAATSTTALDSTKWATTTLGTFTIGKICTAASSGLMTCNYTDQTGGGGGAAQLSELSDVGSSTATAGRILIADGTDFQSVPVSGSVEITSGGATSLTATGATPGAYTSADITIGTDGRVLAVSSNTQQGSIGSGLYRFVNVCTDFNVDCTGASDSYAQFQNAANYVRDNPNTGILIPPGSTVLLSNQSGNTFNIDPDLTTFNYAGGVRLYGGTTIIAYGATINTPSTLSTSGAIFYADDSGDNITILGGRYIGNNETWDGYNVALFRAYLVNNITIRDTHVSNFNSNAFFVTGNDTEMVSNIRIEDNVIEECGRSLGDYQHHTTDGYGNEPDNVSSLYNAEPVYFKYVENFKLDRNNFKRSWADAMEVINSNNGSISFNEVSNSKMGGVFIWTTENIIIKGNRIWADQLDYADTALWTEVQTTGTGLNDISLKGSYPFHPPDTYLVKVTATGATDQFQYSTDGGATWSTSKNMTNGTAVTMGNYIKVQFESKTGHTLNDVWTFTPVGYSRGSRAITIEDDCLYTLVEGNQVWNHGREGLLHFKSGYTTIRNNIFDRNGRKNYTNATYQTFLEGSKDNISIKDNATGSGATRIDNVQIENNTLYADSTNRTNLRIFGSARNVVVKGNHLVNYGSDPTRGGLVLDDRVMHPTSGNWYRCILDHSPTATTEPGVGATWQTYWELDNTNRTVSQSQPLRTWTLSAPSSSASNPYYRVSNNTYNKPILIGNTGSGSGTSEYTLTNDDGYKNIFIDKRNGRVGINTITPTQQLSVAGAISATGGFQFPDGSIQSIAVNSLTAISDDVGSNTKTSGNILVADGSKFQSVSTSGDVTINAAGSLTVGYDKIGANQLASTSVTAGTHLYPTRVTVDQDGRITTISAGSAPTSGGSSAFNDITSGTNTTASMVVGSGGTLSTSGSGTIAATSITATGTSQGPFTNANITVGVDGRILSVANGSTGGAVGFNSITSGTNTTAAMVVGSGATLSTSGSGTIAATSITATGTPQGAFTLANVTVGIDGRILTVANGTETDPQVDTVTSGNFCKGTGTTVSCTDASTYLTAEVDGSTTNEIEVVDEAYTSGNFNGGTTSAVSQDDFYDYQHIGDTDDDGLVNKVDTTTDGFLKSSSSNGTISVDTSTYLTAEVDGSTTNEIQSLFETINASSGTDPVADSSTDTLNLTAGTGITVTGDSSTDTITIASTVTDTDTNANTLCSGTTTYLDGEGNCDDISSVYQGLDSDLTALAGTSTTGLYSISTSGAAVTRAIVAGSNKIDVQNGFGTAGNPTINVNESNLTLSNLGGSVIDSQVPNTITIDLAATSTTALDSTKWATTTLGARTDEKICTYDSDTTTISCTYTDISGGSPSFSTLSSGTNTTAAMVVGTGASLAVSGSGTIAATSIANTAVSAGTYSSPGLTVNAEGRITNIASGSLTGLTDVGSATITSGRILIADGTKFQSNPMSGDVNIATGGATTIQSNSVALGTDTTGNYAAGDAEAGAATTGDSATSFFSTGTLEDARLPSSMADKVITGSLAVPQGTGPTVDAAGEVAVDTTDAQLVYFSGSKRVIPYEEVKCFGLESLVSTDDNFAFFMANDAITVTGVGCNCRGTCSTLATFTLEDRGGNAMTITGTNPTCATTGSATFAAVTAGNTLTAGEMAAFDVTNTPTTGDTYVMCLTYTNDAQ